MKTVPGKTWLGKPEDVNQAILEWQKKFPEIVRIDEEKQFSGDSVYAVTVTANNDKPKKNFMVAVPHAHEPAGTAAAMNFLNEVITGTKLDGSATTLPRDEILEKVRLTFIPLANPFGAKKSPVDWWDGSKYSNEEFGDIMKGRLLNNPPVGTVGIFWHYHPVFNQDAERLEEIGIVWEQLSESLYGEPHFYKGCTWWQLVERLSDEFHYDLLIELHQGMEGWEEMDTLVIRPQENWVPKESLEYAGKVEAKVIEAWKNAGAKPHPGDKEYYQRAGKGWFPDLDKPNERLKMSGDWLSIKCGTPQLTIEVQNNNQRTPAEEQLLYQQTAIEACVEMLL
ncbi:MAG: hypothetical protein K8S55_02085 [Phycisphaerae bacterium]|nr:hypothetical protein [Phycisphaerae bacterium]